MNPQQTKEEANQYMEESSSRALLFIEELKSQLNTQVFSRVVTMSANDRATLTDLICSGALKAYERGRLDCMIQVSHLFKTSFEGVNGKDNMDQDDKKISPLESS